MAELVRAPASCLREQGIAGSDPRRAKKIFVNHFFKIAPQCIGSIEQLEAIETFFDWQIWSLTCFLLKPSDVTGLARTH